MSFKGSILGSGRLWVGWCSYHRVVRGYPSLEKTFPIINGPSQSGSSIPFSLSIIIRARIAKTRSPFRNNRSGMRSLFIGLHCRHNTGFCYAVSLSSSRVPTLQSISWLFLHLSFHHKQPPSVTRPVFRVVRPLSLQGLKNMKLSRLGSWLCSCMPTWRQTIC